MEKKEENEKKLGKWKTKISSILETKTLIIYILKFNIKKTKKILKTLFSANCRLKKKANLP